MINSQWSKIGRTPYQWIEGDIVVDDLDHSLIGAITRVEGEIVYTTFDEAGIHKRDITMVVPWNMRFDIDDEIKEMLK